ncbi:unnamed protein product [Clavelina lepadiformis]|uniref:C2H2-type domain-containing protein n=1 Tax=Clavelina lepadiformis TaxID=159417 RepID=A0ABP0FSB8_CLALP
MEPYSMESLTMMVLNELKSINKNMTNGLQSLQNEMTAFRRDVKEEIRSLIIKEERTIKEERLSPTIVDVNGFPGESMVGQSPCDVVAYEESVFCESGWDNDEENEEIKEEEEDFVFTPSMEHHDNSEEPETVHQVLEKIKIRRQNVKLKKVKKRNLKQNSSETSQMFCKICQKNFHLNVNYKRHMQLAHKEDRPFQCTYCGSKFPRVDHLNDHVLIHTGEKPFSCETCGQGFRRKCDKNRHWHRMHNKPRSYACLLCQDTFNFKSGLRRHMKEEH